MRSPEAKNFIRRNLINIFTMEDEQQPSTVSKKRKRSKPSVEDKSVVNEVPSFSSFRLDIRLLKAVQKQFEKPTLVQAAAIPLAINGRDIVARAKTGSGKTAAYVIPIIHQILSKTVCRLNFSTNLLAERRR